jgi:predicted dehydrogenase
MPETTRRQFLVTTAAGAATLSIAASSYARIRGANDRISIGIIGCGDRGSEAHMPGVNQHAREQNIEITAVCDPWRIQREKAAAKAKQWYGRDVRQFASYKELLALNDVDAVMIASCDHQHTTHLEAAARARKDVYCEKPLGMDLKRVRVACDAVKAGNIVCQVGTQLRSMSSMAGARALVQSGALGRISRIEQCRNSNVPYWYRYIREVRKEDVDWKEFLMGLPARPFDPVRYSGWYGYRGTSDGPVTSFGSHYVDLIHYITGASFPVSAVCLGGVFTWKDKNNFTCPDDVQATWVYPDGFVASYASNFGNASASTFKILGDQGALDLLDWDKPVFYTEGAKEGTKELRRDVEPVERADHFLDWLQCLRSRKTPNASIDAGYQHAVACLMAVRAFDTGRRQVYDPRKREIRNG